MTAQDKQPLREHPAWSSISRVADNRLGAVYSALHSFWSARVTAASHSAGVGRRDAYSAILFDHTIKEAFTNDFIRDPSQLLTSLLAYRCEGGTNFDLALGATEQVMERHWSMERCERADQ